MSFHLDCLLQDVCITLLLLRSDFFHVVFMWVHPFIQFLFLWVCHSLQLFVSSFEVVIIWGLVFLVVFLIGHHFWPHIFYPYYGRGGRRFVKNMKTLLIFRSQNFWFPTLLVWFCSGSHYYGRNTRWNVISPDYIRTFEAVILFVGGWGIHLCPVCRVSTS